MPEPRAAFDVIADGCEEAVAFFQLPMEQARDHVPDEYTLAAGQTGQATGHVAMFECEALAVDGGSPAPARFGEVGILLESSPERMGAFEYYLLWVVTDHAPLKAVYDEMGVATLPAGMSYTGYSILGAYTASGQVALQDGSYKVEVTGRLESMQGEQASIAWHETPHGTWRQSNAFAMTGQGGGPATIVSSEGTQVRDLTGERSYSGAGLINAFSASFQATHAG